jgi:hypothetical protein
MRKSARKPKSAIDKLVDAFMRLRAQAKARMSEEEFREAERKFHEIGERVRARRQTLESGRKAKSRTTGRNNGAEAR